ncbi:MAG: DUF2818 family protein, partial [Burkholderiaceae bacterium]|jgi:hypothetical protein
MNTAEEVWLVLLLGLVLANLPFINERLFVVGPRRQNKPLGWRLFELLLGLGLCIGLGFAMEASLGQRHPQGWAFYAVMASLFLTFAFPGFVWRYLRRRGGSLRADEA